MALLLSAGGLGGFVFPPLVTWLLSITDLQITWLTLAAIHFTFAIIVGGFILVRNKPEDMQQNLDRTLSTKVVKTEDNGHHTPITPDDAVDWQLRKVMRSPMVWLIVVIYVTTDYIPRLFGMARCPPMYIRDVNFILNL